MAEERRLRLSPRFIVNIFVREIFPGAGEMKWRVGMKEFIENVARDIGIRIQYTVRTTYLRYLKEQLMDGDWRLS